MPLKTNFPSRKPVPLRARGGKKIPDGKEKITAFKEENSSSRQQNTNDPPQNEAGNFHDQGQYFEIKMAAVIGLRGMERGDNFELATNVTDAGNFNDLRYTEGGRRYFLHMEHTENPDTTCLQSEELVEVLLNCFESYCCITQDHTFKGLESSEFIIYTNKQLGPKLLQHNREQRVIDVIFKTCDTGEIFNFTEDENKEIDVYTLVEKKLKESKAFGNLSPTEQESKLTNVSTFLNKLLMVTGQKGQNELDNVIIDEIRNLDAVTVSSEMYETESLYFKELLETSLRNKREKVTTETFRNCLQIAKTRTCFDNVDELSDRSRKNHYGTGIKFSASEISRLKAELSDKRAVHLRSDAPTLCSILLMDCLPQSKCIFVTSECLQYNTNMLLHAWLGGHWEWLIVFDEATPPQSDISATCTKISEYITPDLSKKGFIILTSCSVPKINVFSPIEHKFQFEQLSQESKETLREKKVDFQGCKVRMRKVLERHGNVEHVLGPELVTDLIREGNAVNIGGSLQENEGFYAPRQLKRKIYLKRSVVENSDSYPDIFAVSGMEKTDLVKIIPSDEFVGKFCLDKEPKSGNWVESYNKFKMSRFFLLRSKDLRLCFHELCEKHKGKTLHWLKYKPKDQTFLWKQSRGATESLLEHVDLERTHGDRAIIRDFMKRGSEDVNEDSIWKLGERIVLLVAEPGMGKSSTTAQVARNTKLADPTSWVVRINWNEHTRKLQQINAANFNFDSLAEFLCSAAFSESKYTHINRNLLKNALQNSGNVTVLMDGFDKIGCKYATAILSELRKTKVARAWITSLPKQRFEEWSLTSFTFKTLSHESQEKILLRSWISRENSHEEKNLLVSFVKGLLSLGNESFPKTFTCNPSNIKLLAARLEQNIDPYLKSKDFNKTELLQEINSVYCSKISHEGNRHIYTANNRPEMYMASTSQDHHRILEKDFCKNDDTSTSESTEHSSMIKELSGKNIKKGEGTSVKRNEVENSKTRKVMVDKEHIPVEVKVGKDKTGSSMEFEKNKMGTVVNTGEKKTCGVMNVGEDKIVRHRLKRMAHAQKPDISFRGNGAGASVQSTTSRRGVRTSCCNVGYTMLRAV